MTTGPNPKKDIHDLYHELDVAKVEHEEVTRLKKSVKRMGNTVLLSLAVVFVVSLVAGGGFAVGVSGLALVVAAITVPVFNLGMSGAVEKANTEYRTVESELTRELLR